jgi:hypothetical protein
LGIEAANLKYFDLKIKDESLNKFLTIIKICRSENLLDPVYCSLI